MLIDTLDDTKTYLKQTLLQVLQEGSTSELKIAATYKMILRREQKGVKVYLTVRKDPTTGYRMYTGRDIRKILEFEKEFARKRQETFERNKAAKVQKL